MWVGEGLITDELAERLGGTLDHDEEPARAFSLIRLLVFVGALLIGGGLFLFIGGQWDEQSPVRRVLLLLAIYLAVIAGAALAERQNLGTTARGLWFLSSIATGINIFLIGQVFNLPLNFWHGTLLWMIATLAMGWAAPSEPQGWLAVSLGVLTLGWISVPSAQFFDQGAFLFDAGGIRPLLPLIGLVLAAGSALMSDTDFGFVQRPARTVGVAMIAVPLTISTFHPTVFAAVFEMDIRLFHVVLVVLLLAVIGVTWLRASNDLVAYAAITLAVLLVVLLPQVQPTSGASSDIDHFDSLSWLAEPFDDSSLLFGIYNVFIFGFALATAAVGRWLRLRALINVGMGAMAVLMTAIYIGRIAGTLPTAFAVLLGGILLVAGAVVLERKRRDLLGEVAA